MKKSRFLECFLCRRTFKGQKVSNLRRHIRLHGPFIDCWKCLECNRTFQNKSNVRQHWKRVHEYAGTEANMVSVTRKVENIGVIKIGTIIPNETTTFNTQVISHRKMEPKFGESAVFVSTKFVQSSAFTFTSHLPSFTSVQENPNPPNPPKCYGTKTNDFRINTLPRSQITHDIDFEHYSNFGRIEWEAMAFN